MKRRSALPRVERRRVLANLNLAGSGKARAAVTRRGCASLLSRLVVMAAILGAVSAGLR